jgi:Uma2 family endonuclease
MSTVSGDPIKRPVVKLTYDDFVLFPDDGQRHELIDGEHFVTPSPNRSHQTIVGNLYALLWIHVDAHGGGQAFVAPFDVVFSHFDVVEPDVLFISRERAGQILTANNVQGAPDLVVEVGSPGTRRRDERLKQQLYERFGVSEYWVIDPELESIKVYRAVEGRYVRTHELTLEKGDALTTPLLPGLELPLARIFKNAEP